NCEECINGIRSTVICPGEVATPILDQRPVPVSAEERARMLQSEDVADLICYVAALPPHVCLNEVWITPTWNRGYVAALRRSYSRASTFSRAVCAHAGSGSVADWHPDILPHPLFPKTTMKTASTYVIAHDELEPAVTEIFVKAGSSDAESKRIAHYL